MRRQSQELQVLGELENDQQDIAKLRQQRQVVARVQCSLLKKDEEIDQLRALLQKYQAYQQKYTSLKVQLTERAHLLARKDSECKMLRKQMEELLKDQTENCNKIKQYQAERHTLIRERHQMEIAHKEIESTFKEYQAQFRKRENSLAFDLERAYQQLKDTNTRVDQLELIAQDKKVIEQKLKEAHEKIWLQEHQIHTEERQKTPNHAKGSSKQKTESDVQSLLQEIGRLKAELLAKEEELTSNRVLNYELTLEYDSSINGICALQTQLSAYRKENNELKKILSLLREQEKCRQIQQKYTLRNNTHFGTPNSEQESEDDLPTHKPFHSTEVPAVNS